jgi:hypothetical protein
VLEQRVEKAKRLLEEGDLSVAETALSAVTPVVYLKACG